MTDAEREDFRAKVTARRDQAEARGDQAAVFLYGLLLEPDSVECEDTLRALLEAGLSLGWKPGEEREDWQPYADGYPPAGAGDPGPFPACATCGDAGFVEDAEDGTREDCPECGRAGTDRC